MEPDKSVSLLAVKAALDAVNSIVYRRPEKYWYSNKNPLLHRPDSNVKPAAPSDSFRKRLDTIQVEGSFPLRLAKCVWYLKELSTLIIDNIEEGIFAEIEPENIDVSKSFKAFTLAPPTYLGLYKENKDDPEYYKDARGYRNDLVEDNMYKKISRDLNDAFVPKFFQSLRRRICLTNMRGKSEYVRYVFLDDPPYHDDVARGDWITFDKKLYRVVDVQNGMVRLLDMDGKPLQTSGRQKAIFYKNLSLGRYYFCMLGIYMHQLVFAGYRDIPISEPRRVFTVEQWYQPSKIFKLKPLDKVKLKEGRRPKGATSLLENLFKKPSEDGKTRDAESLDLIVARYLQIYLRLRLSNLQESFLGLDNDVTDLDKSPGTLEPFKTRWRVAADRVTDELSELGEEIASVIHEYAHKLNRDIEDDTKLVEKLRTERYMELTFNRNRYHQIVNNMIIE